MSEAYIKIGVMRNMSPREIRVIYSHTGEWIINNDVAKIMFGRDMAEAMVITENSIRIHNITDVTAWSSWSYPKVDIRVVVYIPLNITEDEAERLEAKFNQIGVDETWKWAYNVYANMLEAELQNRNDIAKELFECLLAEDIDWSYSKE